MMHQSKSLQKSHSTKKVLILLDKSPFTSFGRIAASYVKALENEFEVQICYLTSPEYFKPDQEVDGFQVHSPKFVLGFFLFPRGVKKVVQEFQPDWVLAIRPELGFIIKSIKKSFPNVQCTTMIHDMFAETLYPNNFKYKLINRFFIDPMMSSDSFVYNSNYSLNETHKHYEFEKSEAVVGCVIHQEDFYPLEVSSAELKTQWGWEDSTKVYLTLCLDELRKNIKTFFKIAQKMPEAQFVRVGECSPWMEDFLQENSISNVKHFYQLNLTEIRELYNCADALVYTSLLEGFGYPPLEAMACGTQVVSSDTSALSENLKDVAYLVNDPMNENLFVEAIKKLEVQPIQAELLRKRVERFSLTNFKHQLMKHLQQLLDVE